jgi:hypothetical protein
MIVTKTYISKANTIINGSNLNTSLNPVLEINYGNMLTRGMIYFDHSKVQRMVEDKTYPDINKLHHVLKMTNASSITDYNLNHPCLDSQHDKNKMRAASFDLIFFLIPYDWDDGKGFDYVQDLYNSSYTGLSSDCCNWYKYRNHFMWDEEGIYSNRTLSKELDKATNPNGNLSDIIIGYQHFELGNESIELDITCLFNKFITGELENHGLGIAFAPSYENVVTEKSQYVGFFTQHTHSFFEPYVETRYDETISDDRVNFYLDKPNKLYFYASVGNKSVNMDNLPTCTINGSEMPVKQATKGVYYAEVELSSEEYEEDTMLYDIWSNLNYNGRKIKDVELQFVTKSENGYYTFGLPKEDSEQNYEISTYGVSEKEVIPQGDIRKINIECRVPYTSNNLFSVEGIEYRLYVHEGVKQYDVVDWTPVEIGYNENYFLIDTTDFIPHRYFLDIRVKRKSELIYHKDILLFDIANNVTKETT